MKLVLKREPTKHNTTIGELWVNGIRFCATLEDAIREVPGKSVEEWKIYKETAIPQGKYEIIVNWSQRFQRLMPLLLNVPGFTGIRIHAGNNIYNTAGCILVGYERLDNSLSHSKAAFTDLFSLIQTAVHAKEPIFIYIINP